MSLLHDTPTFHCFKNGDKSDNTLVIIKKYKTFSVLIYSYINTSGI